ncbi:MAG: hypothetical protein ISS43_01240 [Candidatus Omnitrophica bacterium]|nr:hypothetical protein [Candidatus Omnitrophota bacterium]
MFLDKTLTITLLISVLFHAAMFLPFSQLLKESPAKKSSTSLKITYLAPRQTPPKKAREKERRISAVKPEIEKKAASLEPKKDSVVKPKDKPLKKLVDIPKPIKQEAKIEIPPELPKEKAGLYLDYYRVVREKIKKYVIDNYPHYIACGEVCLYFVLSFDGELKDINVVEERSSQNRLLKDVAKRSLLQAAPFSPFPKDLSQAQLSFNVIISFELEN